MERNVWDAMERHDKNVCCNRLLATPVDPDNLSGWWRYEDGHEERLRDFVGNRNACALVIDEIERRGHEVQMQFHIQLGNALADLRREVDIAEWERLWEWLRAAPDTICYCALKAVGGNHDDAHFASAPARFRTTRSKGAQFDRAKGAS